MMHLQDAWEKKSLVSVYGTLTGEVLSEVLLSAQEGLTHAQVFFEYHSLVPRIYKRQY